MKKWVIYQISCKIDTIKDTYIGCSTDYYKRKKQHENNSRKLTDNSQYVHYFINENGGTSLWNISIIDNCKNIKTRQELFNREKEYIKLYQPTLNRTITELSKELSERSDYHNYNQYNRFLRTFDLIEDEIATIDESDYNDKSLIDTTILKISPFVDSLFVSSKRNKYLDGDYLNLCVKYLSCDKSDNKLKDWIYKTLKKQNRIKGR